MVRDNPVTDTAMPVAGTNIPVVHTGNRVTNANNAVADADNCVMGANNPVADAEDGAMDGNHRVERTDSDEAGVDGLVASRNSPTTAVHGGAALASVTASWVGKPAVEH